MNSVFKIYNRIFLKYPISSQALQTGLLMGCGDIIAQVFVEKKSVKKIDVVRTGKFTLVGTFFVGPSLILWYKSMDKYFGSKGKIVAVKKVITDQIFFAPMFLASVMIIVSLVQGSSFKESKVKIKNDYPDILINNYKLWPAVQLINFYFIPLSFQVITVQIVAIFWNTYLSWKMNLSNEAN